MSSADSSTLAQQALERAKAIAAKLSGTVPNADANGGLTKRRRWDEPTGSSSNNETADDDETKRAKITAAAINSNSSAVQHEKRIWITTTVERPAQHYVLHLSDQLQELNDSNGVESDEASNISAKLLGKGTDEAVVPGWPQLPLHILLTAPTHQRLTEVAATIQKWIDVADAEPALNYSEQSLAVRNEATHGNTGAADSYRPASVAQLIHGNPYANSDAPLTNQITFGVPHSVVGYIIGRGGSTLAQLQATTGVSVQIQKETDLEPGQTDRQITLSAPDEASLENGKRQIEKLVREKCGPTAMGGAAGLGFTKKHMYDAKIQEAIAAGHAHMTIQVPEDDVGLVIGKQGATIRHIQESSGCNVQVMPAESNESKIEDGRDKGDANYSRPTRAVHITHPTEHGAQAAKSMIEELLANKPHSHGGGGGGYYGGGSSNITIQVAIPDRDVGLCIGRQGSVIRQIQGETNTRVQIPPQCGPGETHRIISVTGSPEGTDKARRMMETISAEQSAACVMSGFDQYQARQQQGFNYGQQQQSQPHDPNQQYSAEWQAFKAAQASVQKQHQQEPPQAQIVTATPALEAAPAADAYHEQFFRYAYYYGEEAARQYYGAWSPPHGTPNPYGVNPTCTLTPLTDTENATVVAPTTSVVASAAASSHVDSAVAAPSTQNARDSSQRRVSNLPAWMTKK
ncbi:hypothetical protein MPSEU_000470700 [Mayamaea pseudoterrestris]|nr:hypothetical protein MPSEU_000470700 [Mayamaea pseudoterrestris]